MLIANPIYDTVFKYLMENIDIAKGIISTIIDQEIVTLDLKAQESIYKGEKSLTVYHLDFIARIRKKEDGYMNVLIELRKSNLPYDIMRFRRYLGEQYKKVDEVMLEDGTGDKELLRILELEEMAEREYENAFGEMERKLMKQEKVIVENKKALEEKDKHIRELLAKLENKK